jgi:hypothetical protein
VIDQIIEALWSKRALVEFGVLPKDEHGDPPQVTYNYADAVGMLHYLQGSLTVRLDIRSPLSQCVRYTREN